MSKFIIAAILTVAVFLPGCAAPTVNYSDLRPATTATVAGDTVTVHLGSDLTNSACWTHPNATIEGNAVYVSGTRSIREQSREFVVRLPRSLRSQPVAVVWIDPDGSPISVPVTR